MTQTREMLIVGLQDDIMKLARPYDHQEMADGKQHRSKHPSLLDQLEDELIESTPAGEGSGSKQTPGSKPPVREDIAILIWDADRIAVDLLKLLGGKVRQNTDESFALIGALAASANDETLRYVCYEVNKLRSAIETQLSWKLRPRHLAGACPICDKKNSLVVQMDSYGPTGARCSKCSAAWAKEQLGLLAGALQGGSVNVQAV